MFVAPRTYVHHPTNLCSSAHEPMFIEKWPSKTVTQVKSSKCLSQMTNRLMWRYFWTQFKIAAVLVDDQPVVAWFTTVTVTALVAAGVATCVGTAVTACVGSWTWVRSATAVLRTASSVGVTQRDSWNVWYETRPVILHPCQEQTARVGNFLVSIEYNQTVVGLWTLH